MVERSADQPVRVDLRHPALPEAGEPRMGFDPGEGIGDHLMMGRGDRRPHPVVPSAHSRDTLLTGVNIRSYPATGRCSRRPSCTRTRCSVAGSGSCPVSARMPARRFATRSASGGSTSTSGKGRPSRPGRRRGASPGRKAPSSAPHRLPHRHPDEPRRSRPTGRAGCRWPRSSRPGPAHGRGPHQPRRPAGSNRCSRPHQTACAPSSPHRHHRAVDSQADSQAGA